MKKIGIPRGMLYYENFPFWEEYFEGIGLQVIPSSKTNKNIMNNGILKSVDEACLPVKIFHGHVDYLKDKVDYIFIPKVISLHKKEYCCPKVLGLSDMVKSSIDDIPEIIDVIYDLSKKNGLEKGYKDLAGRLNVSSSINSKAFKNALAKADDRYKDWIQSDLLPKKSNYNPSKKNILILGHTYNVFDDFINMDILNKLIDKEVNILTAEDVSERNIRIYSNAMKKRMFWTHGRRIIGAANYYLHKEYIDGIIYLSSFGCGLDSVLTYFVSKESANSHVPYMNLTLDEQTGEAGMNTRLEAFLDMMKWRDKNKSYISTSR